MLIDEKSDVSERKTIEVRSNYVSENAQTLCQQRKYNYFMNKSETLQKTCNKTYINNADSSRRCNRSRI
jgi:hypothetical protein